MIRAYITGLIFSFFLPTLAKAQDINLQTPTSITVCEEVETFFVKVTNNEGLAMNNNSISISLPTGISMVEGSLVDLSNKNAQEATTSSLNSPIITTNTIADGDSLYFQIDLIAETAAIDFLLDGNTFRNIVSINSSLGTINKTSSAYNLLYASLNITKLTPTSKELSLNETFNRNITIVNAGYGKVSSFFITDVRSTSGLDLTSTNLGTLSNSGDTIFLSANDFETIGNGDGYFDSNEKIVITETLQASLCQNTTITSTINAIWGCASEAIITSDSYAHATVSYDAPNLSVTATSDLIACFGNNEASQQQLVITNNGSGLAKNVIIDIFKSISNGYEQNIFSRMDANSIQYKIDNENFQSITAQSTTATTNDNEYNCLGANPIGQILVALPDLEAGQKITLTWDMYHCGISACLNQKVMGWGYELDYDDQCLIQHYEKAGTGQTTNNETMPLFSETPTDIQDGQKETFTYTISSFSNQLPEGDGAYYEVLFSLPTGLTFSGNTTDLTFHSGPTNWTASQLSYNATTNVITAHYPLPAPFQLPKAEINLDLSGDCSQAGAIEGNVMISLDINYIPDTNCNPDFAIPFVCDFQTGVDLHCPGNGVCEGLKFTNYYIERTNFGNPDNNQDGLPDGSGILSSAIKKNRVMVGDTLRGTFQGFVASESAARQWAYGYASSDIEEGTNLTAINASIMIYDASTSTYLDCDNVNITSNTTGSNQQFNFDFNSTLLKNNCANFSNYTFEVGDSIWLYTNFKVTGNIGGNVQEVKVSNEFYLSDIANPSNQTDKFQCGYYNDKFTLIGYYFSNSWVNRYSVRNCTKVIEQSFWFSVGNCCSNFAGGDLFPYEYRNWAHVKQARVTIPANYTVLGSTVNQQRTKFTNASVKETVEGISTSSYTGTTLTFDLEQHYKAFGGTINYSDEGFSGTISIEVAPSCDVPTNTYEDIDWAFTFEKTAAIGGGETDWFTTTPDQIRFSPTELEISSTNPIVDGLSKTVTWNVKLRNTTGNTDAANAWFHIKTPSGELEVLEVVDATTNEVLSMVGDIYQVGELNRNQSKNYRITAKYGACNVDKLWIYSGYECAGYPVSFYQFTCPYTQMELQVSPKPSDMQAIIDGNTIGGECSNQVEVTIEVASVKLAIVDSLSIAINLPENGSLTYSTANTAFLYPLSANYETVIPTNQNGNTITFETVNYDPQLANNGLPGVLNLDSNKVRLKFMVDIQSNFKPGDFVGVTINGKQACGQALPTIQMAYDPSIKFEKNQLSGLSNENGNSWSVAWVDYNNDGNEDVFITNYETDVPSKLYKNNGDGTFSIATNIGDLGTDLGGAVSSTWGDYNNDGAIDVFVSNNIGAKNGLFTNNGDGTFSKVTSGDIANYNGYNHNAAWADYDNDGFLDLFVTEYFSTRFNLLYHNNGDGTFTLVKNTALTLDAGNSIGATWSDMDNDGDLDLFVPNTGQTANNLYRNDGNGSFTKITTGAIVTDKFSSVGGSWGDYDNDGDMDLFVANSGNQNNNLYRNNGDGTFTRITSGVIVNDGGHSHGSAWADIDNDGDLDLYVTNDQGGSNFLYTNNGDGTFKRFEGAINEDVANSFGTAWGDYDNDGDLDLVVANRANEVNDFYTNSKGSCNAWACFTLNGTRSNQSAIGAKIRIKANVYGNDIWQVREISAQTGGGAGGQNSLKALFGLGDATGIDSVIIEWPSGAIQYMTNTSLGDCHYITEEYGSLISGMAYHDANNNCSYDLGETKLSNRTITIAPDNRQVTTDANGIYQTYLNAGNYQVTAIADEGWFSGCSSTETNHAVNASGIEGSTYTNLDFPFQAIVEKSDLSVNIATTALRRGYTNNIVLTYENTGTTAATNSILTLTLDEDIIPLNSDITWTSTSNNVYQWDLGTVPIGAKGIIIITDSVANFATLGTLKDLTADISTTTVELNLANNTSTATEEIVGSFDPNDKQAFPKGIGKNHLITKTQRITYKIRFQNVGNYKASRVIILDTLSQYLDPSTIGNVVMSHKGRYEIKENQLLQFTFDDIELPDSISNEPESHGFVQFDITPKESTPEQVVITNSAAIQFDFNDYIYTNTVFHTIESRIGDRSLFSLKIFPNPTLSGQTNLSIQMFNDYYLPINIVEWQIFSFSGHLQCQKNALFTTKATVNCEELTQGMYYIKVKDESGFWYTSKLIKY